MDTKKTGFTVGSLLIGVVAYTLVQLIGPGSIFVALIIGAASYVWYCATTPAEKPPGRNQK